MKKTIAMILVVVLCCAASVGLTVAYLTDRDSAANIFTVGDVRIDLTEDFEQGSMLIPGVDINKDPYITNTGKNDAWVWATVAIPAAFDNADASKNVVHFNFDDSAEYDQQWVWLNNYAFVEKEINGIKYNEYTILYQTPLKPGEKTSTPFMTNVYLDYHIDIDPNGDWYHVENGNVTGPYWNSNTDPTPMLYVCAYAIQKESFATVKEGYDAYIAQWGKLNGSYATTKAPVMENGVMNLTDDVIMVDDTIIREYTTTEPYTVEGNGKTVTMVASSVNTFDWIENGTIPLQSMIFSSGDGSLATVNDLTITGTMQSVMAGHYISSTDNRHNTVFNNVNIVDAEVVSFSENISPALTIYGTMTMNNCKVYGTTLSPMDTDPMWPVYDVAVVNYTNTTMNDCQIGSIFVWNQAKLTIADGTEVDTMVIRGNMNTTKYGVTIQAGAAVDVIDVSAIANKAKVNITIEDGATVGKVVANGVEYATLQDWLNA